MQPKQQNSFTYDELIRCAKGEMFGPGNPQLPLPPMLMCDRITHIDDTGGAFGNPTFVAGPPRFYGIEFSYTYGQ